VLACVCVCVCVCVLMGVAASGYTGYFIVFDRPPWGYKEVDLDSSAVCSYAQIVQLAPLYPHRTLWRYTNVVLLLLLLLTYRNMQSKRRNCAVNC